MIYVKDKTNTMSTTPDQAPSQPTLTRLQRANATLNGPKTPDVSPHAGSSSVAIDRVGELERAAGKGVLFMRGAQLDELGSEAVRASGLPKPSEMPTITAARLTPEAPAGDAPAEVPVIVHAP